MISLKDTWRGLNKPLFISTIVLLISLFWLFQQSLFSAMEIWAISEIFNHCFLVVPGCIYLIYRQKNALQTQTNKPFYWCLIPLILLVLLQLFGAVGQIQLFTHVALFASIPFVIIYLFGLDAAKKIPFPLVFILLAIPIGEELIPFLQAITADMAVFLLQITGIPVYKSGLYIDIPAGKFLVAEACSGISFFISSIAFGSLYAHLSYKTNKAKIIFFIFAACVPIFANALRVYGIIIIAYLSDMQYAVGADHLIYGWFFYALVLLIIFFIGERFRNIEPGNNGITSCHASWKQSNFIKPILIITSVYVIAGVWQQKLLTPAADQHKAVLSQVSLTKQQQHIDSSLWGINFNHPSEVLFIEDNSTAQPVQSYTALFTKSNTQGEMVSSLNKIYDIEAWSFTQFNQPIPNDLIIADAKVLDLVTGAGIQRRVLSWYIISDYETGSNLKAKLYGTYKKLLSSNAPELSFSCSYLYDDNLDQTRVIKTCLNHLASIKAAIK